MGIFDSTIVRYYRCTDEKCQGEICVEEKVKDDWQTKCPFCGLESLILDRADSNISIFMDYSKPKTIGALAEQNTKEKIKTGEMEQIQKEERKNLPFWRKSKKINYQVLKNPQKYIREGKV
jgi:hypothetical protein